MKAAAAIILPEHGGYRDVPIVTKILQDEGLSADSIKVYHRSNIFNLRDMYSEVYGDDYEGRVVLEWNPARSPTISFLENAKGGATLRIESLFSEKESLQE